MVFECALRKAVSTYEIEMTMKYKTTLFLGVISLFWALPLAGQELPPDEPEAPTVTPPAPPTTCAAQAHERARASVVQVISAGRVGAGVLIADSSHVVTPLSIVEQGHGIDIIDADGNRRRARIILTADGDGLAMLELDAALPGQPLPLAPASTIEIGLPVALIGVPSDHSPRGAPHSLRGMLPWAASEGVISSVGQRAIQTDATVRMHSGSPVVTCGGELVAVLGTSHELFGGGPTIHAMPSVPALLDLTSRIDRPEGYGGRFQLTGGLALAAAYEDPTWLWGASLHIGLIGLDSFILGARFTYLFQNDTPEGTAVLSVKDERFRGDAFLGWRQILAFGHFAMHFELALGASVTSVEADVRRAEIVVDGAGVSSVAWREDETQFWSVRPMAVLNLIHGPMLASYTLEVDIDREHAVHLFQLGARF